MKLAGVDVEACHKCGGYPTATVEVLSEGNMAHCVCMACGHTGPKVGVGFDARKGARQAVAKWNDEQKSHQVSS